MRLSITYSIDLTTRLLAPTVRTSLDLLHGRRFVVGRESWQHRVLSLFRSSGIFSIIQSHDTIEAERASAKRRGMAENIAERWISLGSL